MPGSGLLPFRPPPLPQEMLSSWIVRLCLGLGCELQAFTTQILGTSMLLWNGDVDRQVPEAAILGLSRYTGYEPELVRSLTLQAYKGAVFHSEATSGPLRWVLPVMAYRWKTHNPGMQFCADCLAADQVPYFRKFWRLSFYTFCPGHQKLLRESCPNCGVSPLPVRRDFSANPNAIIPLHFCARCLVDLRESTSEDRLGLSITPALGYTKLLTRIEDSSLMASLDVALFDRLYFQTRGLIAISRVFPDGRLQPRVTAQNGSVRERYHKIAPFVSHLP